MRRQDKELTNIEEIEGIIRKAVHCRIGLVDNDEPYIVPVNFGYQRGALYFHSFSQGRKIELLRKNNRTCFEIDTDVEPVEADDLPMALSCGAVHTTMRYRSVIGTGKAHILESDAEKAHGLKLIVRQCGDYTRHYTDADLDFPKSALDRILVVRVDIERLTGKKSRL
ncbi:MAG: pyridoxamine 5'-phosphate oxidase family protein [Chloroflexi bacterium]|nr:pyridoxamine 5'-phosphate oxidase family protein [Chloroflexota bacterium]